MSAAILCVEPTRWAITVVGIAGVTGQGLLSSAANGWLQALTCRTRDAGGLGGHPNDADRAGEQGHDCVSVFVGSLPYSGLVVDLGYPDEKQSAWLDAEYWRL